MRPILIAGALALLFVLNNSCNAAQSLPRSLGEIKLGAVPSEKLLVPLDVSEIQRGNARQTRDLRSHVTSLMWRRLFPNTLNSGVIGSVTLYKGKVVSIYFSAPNLTFGRAEADVMRVFGKSQRDKTLVSEVLEGCEPYMFDEWIDGRFGLYLIGDEKAIGVSVHLRDNNLNHRMETDSSVQIEYEQCVEF